MTIRKAPPGWIRLGDILEQFDERLGNRVEPEVLTLTEKQGFVSQLTRFNKRLAVEDTSDYKVVRLFDVAFNPYLLWAGAVAQNVDWREGIISPLYPTFRVRQDFDPRFVNYILHGPEMLARYDRISFGSVPRKRRASTEDFLDIAVPSLPPLAEQKRIAAVLDKADDLRGKRRQALATIDTLLQSVFLDMFGDPVTNPKGLKKTQLGKMIKLKSGEFLPQEQQSGGRVPVYGGNGVTGYHDVPLFDHPVVTIGRVGYYCGAIHLTNGPSWVTDNALYVAEKTDDLTTAYLVAALRHARLNRLASQSAQPLVSGGRIYPVEILVPPVALQREFEHRSARAQVVDDRLQKSRVAIDALFATLQSAAFEGTLFNGEMVKAAASKPAHPTPRPPHTAAV